jgi:hypothetical protein
MKRLSMKHFTAGLLALLAAVAGAQETRESEILPGGARELKFECTPLSRSFTLLRFQPVVLGDRLRFATTLGDDSAWLSLDDSAGEAPARTGGLPMSIEVGARERWLMGAVKGRFKGVTAAETVERSTVRHDGVTRTVTNERGVEVRGSPESLGQVRDFFDRFKAGSRASVTLELRVLEIADQAGGGDGTATAQVATRDELEKRIAELAAKQRTQKSMHAPTVKVYANQTAKLATSEQISYIKDYQIEVVGGQKIADPVLGVVEDGFEMEFTPIRDPDGGALIVAGSIGFNHVVRPIPEHRVKIGDTEVTVQLPSVRSNRWSGEVKLEPGKDAFKITGLKQSLSGAEQVLSVEVWCLVTLENGEPARTAGEIVDRDETNGNVFVSFPRDYVPDDPWTKAPKEVDVYRRNEKIGTARLAGGWVLGDDAKNPVVAIYQLAEGTPRDGDLVR